MSEIELLNCPFCGGKAKRIDIEDGENAGGSCICCTVCNASGNLEFGFKENFVDNWNRRTDLSQASVAAALEAVIAMIRKGAPPKGSILTSDLIPAIRALITDRDRDDLAAHVAAEVAKARDAGVADHCRDHDCRLGKIQRFIPIRPIRTWN